MVNTEDFIRRLEKVLDYYALSASAFADTIGVQRSGLSHLLSGRNKPSLDFILKITEHYPEVDLYWLLNGTGVFPKDQSAPVTETIPPPIKKNDTGPLVNSDDNPDEVTKMVNNTVPSSLSETIERIVFFFKDGSFKSYNPRE